MNSFTDIFQQHFNPPLPPISPHDVSIQAPHNLNTCGKPWDICPLGRWEILQGGEFLCGDGIWGGVILTIQTFFKTKKQHIVKIPPVGV